MIEPLPPGAAAYGFMSGEGETARLMRTIDWARTPIGAIAGWPAALKTLIGVILNSRQPMFLWWGQDLIQFYNDAYKPSFGAGKHPAAMGQRGADCWQEIWSIIWPQIDDVMSRGKASWNEDQLVPIFRNGRIEDVYWTYGYSPVLGDDGAVAGTLVVCSETTSRVVAERRQKSVCALADVVADAAPGDEVPLIAMRLILQTSIDVPVALHYRQSSPHEPPVWLRWLAPDAEALSDTDQAVRRHLAESESVRTQIAAGIPALLQNAVNLPGARGPEPVTDMFLVPARGAHAQLRTEFIAYGLNPRIPFDDAYRAFLVQLTASISLAKARGDASAIQIAAENERNNLLLQAPVATAVFVGPEMTFQLANPLYCAIVGRRELLGKTYAEAFPELIGTELPGILQTVYRTGIRHVSAETLVRLDRDGSGRLQDCYFEFNLEPMRSMSGEVYGLMAVAVDVTAQVAARHAVERSHEERERLLARAEAASRAKDEFLAMLGHELRNPLSPIVTALHVMKLRNDTVTQKEQATIRRQVEHLVRLVDDLLDVSSITRGKVQLKQSSTPLTEILTKAVEMARQLLDEHNHALNIEVPDEPVIWWGDAARLAQVVANLLTNAARYTPRNGRISLAAARQADKIVIRVKDNGIGISPEMLPHLFEMFFQGRQGVDRAEGGLGLGLALVQNLVAMHGGSARAFSAGIGKGSEFVVTLPLRSVDPAMEADATNDSSMLASRRILIIDDNRDAGESLAEILRLEGHTVQVAYQALTGLALADHFKPEIAVLDIGLPGMDGFELALRFRERFDARSCKLIALSGYGQENDKERSAAAGFAVHLVKPVDLEKLRAAL